MMSGRIITLFHIGLAISTCGILGAIAYVMLTTFR